MAEEQRHGLADVLEQKLPELRTQWETGSAAALINAFVWCAGNAYPFPQWLLDAVFDELTWSRDNRPRGGTKTGNSAALERNSLMHNVRFLLMQQFLDFQHSEQTAGRRTAPVSEIEAARDVQAFLIGRKHPAQGTPEAIRRSYKRLKGV